jgi:putative NADH-flavin reductase
MRIAVAGATGHIGSLAPSALERDGHEVVRISRSLGVDLLTGEGLDDALLVQPIAPADVADVTSGWRQAPR